MQNELHGPADLLYRAVLSLKTPEECRAFFEDLCTVAELKAMSQRLEVAQLLDEGLISKEGTRIIVDRAQHQALRDFLSQKVHLDPSGMSFK